MEINHPAIVAELRECHEIYEQALVENEVATLDSLFWDSPHSVRYGVTENLYGSREILLFRQNRPKINLARNILKLHITALGEATGIVNLEYVRPMNGNERHGRQTQFWQKFPGVGWKIVSAHVSMLPPATSYLDAAAAQIGLTIHSSDHASVQEDFARITAIAGFLMEFPLDQTAEQAPVFQP